MTLPGRVWRRQPPLPRRKTHGLHPQSHLTRRHLLPLRHCCNRELNLGQGLPRECSVGKGDWIPCQQPFSNPFDGGCPFQPQQDASFRRCCPQYITQERFSSWWTFLEEGVEQSAGASVEEVQKDLVRWEVGLAAFVCAGCSQE